MIFLLVSIAIFAIFEYKKNNLGNNISKSDDTDILSISSYEAKITVEVNSNKNINKYVINQKYVEPNIFIQEIVEPESIKGIKITYNGDVLRLENTALNLDALYEGFNGSASNLSLISFINAYKTGNENEFEETDEEIILKTKVAKNQNKYQMYQKLYVSKKTKLPTKMEILDVNNNRTVYILYNEINLNKITKKDIM